jgi:hypothetical protein
LSPRKGEPHPFLAPLLAANGRYLNGWPV